MLLKIIIIGIVVIIAGEAAYFLLGPFPLLSNNSKNGESSDSVSAFLQNMSETLHWMNFSKIQATEMQWNVEKDGVTKEVVLNGKGFKTGHINEQSYKDLKDYFDKLHNAFELDFFNTSSGSSVEYFGYRKRNELVCTVAGQIWQETEKGLLWEAVVKCAQPPSP